DRPPVRVGVTISDYLTGIFSAQAALGALYARDARRQGKGAVVDAALYGAVLRILEWTLPAYDLLGTVRTREGNRLANSAPLDNYPTADGKYVCIVAGSDANFSRLCKAMDRADLVTDARFAKLADRAARRDSASTRAKSCASSTASTTMYSTGSQNKASSRESTLDRARPLRPRRRRRPGAARWLLADEWPAPLPALRALPVHRRRRR